VNHPTTNVKTACLLLLLSAACLCSADTTGIAVPSGPVQVLRITPQGDTYSYQRQIVVQFDRPMIVLGAAPPRLKSVLVSIKPSLDCNWHWVNPTTLTCELGERGGASGSPGYAVQAGQGGLAPATSYQVVVKAGIKALDGSALPQNVTSTFITEKPKVRYAYLMEWSGPTSPLLEVDFNLPVTQSSVESHVYFESSAGRTPISAKVDPNDNRDFYVIPAWVVHRYT
jgi:alpha-2-macroglobulin